jgi:hypothetical protein
MTWLMVWVLLVSPTVRPTAQGKELLQTIFKRKQPPSVKDPSVETLAAEIDWLEKHIDNYGTVVPKHPDVWGQARLTKHRQEFEKVMYNELGNFNLLVNGTISRSDSAFLANAFALSAAVSGSSPAGVTATSVSGLAGSGNPIATTTIGPSQFSGFTQPGIALEPTIALDQRARYLNHLHELRRMNEGDDTSVSPGYALNLVRIPISAISGRSTRKGYGAEIVLTASSILTPSLLPTTFRSLVINDVVDQLGLPITQIADQKPWEAAEDKTKKQEQRKTDMEASLQAAKDRLQSLRPQTMAADALHKAINSMGNESEVSTDALKNHPNNAIRSFVNELQLPENVRLSDLEKHLTRDNLPKVSDATLDLTVTSRKLEAAQNHATKILDEADSTFLRLPEQVQATLNDLRTTLDQSKAVGLNATSATKAAARATNGSQTQPKDGAGQGAGAKGRRAGGQAGTAPETAPALPTTTAADKDADKAAQMAPQIAIGGVPKDSDVASAAPAMAASEQAQIDAEQDAAQSVLALKVKAQAVLDATNAWADMAAKAQTVTNNLENQLHQHTANVTPATKEATNTTATAQVVKILHGPFGPAARQRQARNPIPPSQVVPVYGVTELSYVAKTFFEEYTGPNVRWDDDKPKERVMLLDVQRYLADELDAAYDLLSTEENTGLWVEYIPAVTEQILSGRFQALCQTRCAFYNQIRHWWPTYLDGSDKTQRGQQSQDGAEPIPAGAVNEELLPIKDCSGDVGTCDEQVVKSLAWAIIVEAAMLNHQLIKDMQHIAMDKQCNCAAACAEGLFMPQPSPEACAAFNAYVECRWPLHIFALDPVAQQQNIEDAFNRRRELQLTMSLGFIGGQINAQDMMQFSRQLDTDIETVALNQTAVGFSHGDDTFGWRFYPRLQTPDTPGNIVAFGQTLFGGPSKDCDLLQRQLEPGMRECTALVIMPSFVPQILIESRASWFRLTERAGYLPTKHHRELSMLDTMKLSRSIRSMHDMSELLCDSRAYREGDVQLLLTRVHQLDRSLPLQAMPVQIPIENTVGGYQLFNHGVTDLAPELRGWYGAPGILVSSSKSIARMPCVTDSTANCNCGAASGAANAASAGAAATQSPSTTTQTATTQTAAPAAAAATATQTSTTTTQTKSPTDPYTMVDCPCNGTTLFLVGDHFSVHDTKIIAGGVCIPTDAFTLMSREVMRITIPSNVQTVKLDGDTYVDIHVATPYGVTGHLHVPALVDKPESATPAPVMPSVVWDQTPTYMAQICYKQAKAAGSGTGSGNAPSPAPTPATGTAPAKPAPGPGPDVGCEPKDGQIMDGSVCYFKFDPGSGPLSLMMKVTFAAPPALLPRKGQIVIRLQPQTAAGAAIPPPIDTCVIPVDFNSTATSSTDDLLSTVEAKIGAALANRLMQSQNATVIVGDTYVDFDSAKTGLPTVKLGNQFKITLSTPANCNCTSASASSKPDTGTQAGSPIMAPQFNAPVFPVSQQFRPVPDERFTPVANPMRGPEAVPVAQVFAPALPAAAPVPIQIPAPVVQLVQPLEQAVAAVQPVLAAPAHSVVMMVPPAQPAQVPPKHSPLKNLRDSAKHLINHTKPFDPPNR